MSVRGGGEVTARLGAACYHLFLVGSGLGCCANGLQKLHEPAASARLNMASAGGGYHERLGYAMDNDRYVFSVRSLLSPCDEKK
jgi:hypothetical protein